MKNSRFLATMICIGLLGGVSLASIMTRPAVAQSKQDRSTPKQAAAPQEIQALRDRVDQLEEKIDDMDVIIATLESLVGSQRNRLNTGTPSRSGPGAVPPSALRGTQPGAGQPGAPLSAPLGAPAQGQPSQPNAGGFGQTTIIPNRPSDPLPDQSFGDNQQGQQGAQPRQPQRPQQPQRQPKQDDDDGGFNWFGFGRSSNERPQRAPNRPQQQVAGYQSSTSATKDYERAYNFMLKQDYRNAETAFRTFIDRHGASTLAGNAYFWLGEAYYEQQRFREAASTYLEGYRQYKSGQRAPDSMLKLGIALGAMGERAQACATLKAIPSEFPAAPIHVRRRNDRERQRLGCG